MVVVLVTELAILVIMQPGHHYRPTRTTAGRSGERVPEDHTILGQCIDMRRLGDRIAVTAECRTLVICDEKYDVSFRRR